MEIELASRKLVEMFGPACPRPAEVVEPQRARGRTAAQRKSAGTPRQRSRCACGKCATCKENARWERIFSEKFADPDYYRRPTTLCGSSLSSWG